MELHINNNSTIEELIKSIINYYQIETYQDNNYDIYNYKYDNDENYKYKIEDYKKLFYIKTYKNENNKNNIYVPMVYNHFIIKFDEKFKYFDISKIIKNGLNKLKMLNDVNPKTEKKIIEKKKNNEYIFMYNINSFQYAGLFYDNVKEYKEEIKKLLLYIFDISNYKYPLDYIKEYPDNQYKILNNDYIIINYKDYKQEILMKILDRYNEYYNWMNDIVCNDEIVYFIKDNTFCFKNNKIKNQFEKYLKEYYEYFDEE